MKAMPEIRVRTKIGQVELDEKIGKILTEDDFNFLLTGSCRVYRPNGSLLCVYIREAIPPGQADLAYSTLHLLKSHVTKNRGLSSGFQRVREGAGVRTATPAVASALVGAMENQGARYPYCRQTAFAAREVAKFKQVFPMLRLINGFFRQHVADRWAAQMQAVMRTPLDWVIPDTVFSTVTVNNTYPTGVHKDAGDLEEGYSCLAVLRRGDYSGGYLTFPQFRIAVDMKDRDLILMDAHEWHGNVKIDTRSDDAERISVVCYFRTKLQECETAEKEKHKAMVWAERGFKGEEE